jgi:histone-lysine N-methyltransferase EZH2
MAYLSETSYVHSANLNCETTLDEEKHESKSRIPGSLFIFSILIIIRSSNIDFDADTFIPTDPCTHPGLCTLDNPDTCPCAQSGAHCTGTCDCSAEKQKCIRSWRGCTCTKSRVTSGNKTCGTARCPCFRAHRECDPVLCVKCCSRGMYSLFSLLGPFSIVIDPEADVCKNSLIQHMRHKVSSLYWVKERY